MKFVDFFSIFIRGILMGSADIVPGVSGGTIALITGIYERLVHSISTINFTFIKPLLKGDLKGFKDYSMKLTLNFSYHYYAVLDLQC